MKFSIRDLMWFTFVVALVLAWWSNRQWLIAEANGLRTELRAAQMKAVYQQTVMDEALSAQHRGRVAAPTSSGPTPKLP